MTNEQQPMGQPQGTVRAWLALIIVGTFAISHLIAAMWLIRGGLTTEGVAVLGALALEAATTTGWYFGSRSTPA